MNISNEIKKFALKYDSNYVLTLKDFKSIIGDIKFCNKSIREFRE